ncbi:4797_t:CDS:2, partial [Diversispora eburnea]
IDLRCDDTPASDISNNASNSDELNNAPNSDVSDNAFSELSENVCQETKTQCSTSPICIETKSFDDKEIEFLDRVHKEQIGNEIRERNRKKKLQNQGSTQNTSPSSDIQNEVNPVIDQAQNTGIKIPYNKRVEQDLRHDLSVFIKENNNKVSEVFDIQIPEFSLEVIVTGSSKITAQNIADLFIIAMKVRQKEILCWYCYYKAYEDRVEDIKRINKIDDQSARTLIYNEIKALLPDITDVNLRQRTFRAKKIYTLLMGIGVEKVQVITCSASAISSLTDNQIQDIIDCFPKNFISIDDSSVKCKKMIGVTNCNAHVTEQTLPETETMANKTLTPKYLEWEAKLTELPSILTDKIRSRFCKRYKKRTGLDPWINSETPESPQIEKTDNHLSRDCIIKISKFPEEKGVIIEAVHKRFPFLSYTKSNAWYRDVFKYTDPEAKCPICNEVHTHLGIWGDWSCLGKDDHYFLNCPFRIDQKKVIIAVQSLPESVSNKPRETEPRSPTHPNKNHLYQYAIEHGIDPKKFSVITEAEKKRWSMGYFRGDLERDIRFYRGGIKRNEDTRKYHKFLTDRDRLVGEELLRCDIQKSGLSTAWLDDLMKE